MFTVELNIDGLNERLVKDMTNIGANNGYKVFYHGYDHLVFTSDRGINFTNLVRGLSTVCEVYNVDYVSLLV